jgi:hypothetical protein
VVAVAPWGSALSDPPPTVQRQADFVDPVPVQTAMHRHFATVRDIHAALLENDLKRARRLAGALARLSAPGSLPGWQEAAAGIRDTAGDLARAKSGRRARRLLAELTIQCGDCHEDSADLSRFVWSSDPLDDGTAAGRMARHEWAAESVWMGLVGPSDDLWRDGLTALAEAPLPPEAFGADREQVRTFERLSRRMASLASRARRQVDDQAQAAAFAEILDVCASCHTAVRRGQD